jgi:hypothetical protein
MPLGDGKQGQRRRKLVHGGTTKAGGSMNRETGGPQGAGDEVFVGQ